MKSRNRRRLEALAMFAVVAFALTADAALAQNFNGGPQRTFTTGLGSGIDNTLSMLVNGARVFAIAGGIVHIVRNGLSWMAGDRDALESAKGVIIGLIVIAASYSLAEVVLNAAGAP